MEMTIKVNKSYVLMKSERCYTVWNRKTNKPMFAVWQKWISIEDTAILNNDIIMGFLKCVHAYNCHIGNLLKAFDNVVRDYNEDVLTDFDFYCM